MLVRKMKPESCLAVTVPPSDKPQVIRFVLLDQKSVRVGIEAEQQNRVYPEDRFLDERNAA